MKVFEISSKANKNGQRHFKAVLHEIYPDDCVDVKTGLGTKYNDNGICWQRSYCEDALPSLVGTSLKCEFTDNDERDDLWGHGMTGIKDGIPLFENATVIGHFTKGYIETVQTDEGEKTLCIGEGEFDASCYTKLNEKFDKEISMGDYPECSIEIAKCPDENGIIYDFGKSGDETGRIPKKFIYFGLAVLGIRPSDKTSLLIELNQKNKEDNMEKEQFDALVSSVTENVRSVIVETNNLKNECEQKIAEANQKVAEAEQAVANKEVECNELSASVDTLQKALDQAKADLDAAYQKETQLYREIDEIRKELAKAQAAQRVSEMNSAMSEFSDEEKGYAKELLDEFNKDPMTVEINSVVSKIHEEIGKKAKEAQKTAEINSTHSTLTDIDIFGEVVTGMSADDTSIF